MNNAWTQRQSLTLEDRRLYEQERLTLWATELISEAMDDGQISKADLARLLGTSRANVTALLSGQRNMTLRTLADVACVLDQRVSVTLEPLRVGDFVSTAARIHRPAQSRVTVSEQQDTEPQNVADYGERGSPAADPGMEDLAA